MKAKKEETLDQVAEEIFATESETELTASENKEPVSLEEVEVPVAQSVAVTAPKKRGGRKAAKRTEEEKEESSEEKEEPQPALSAASRRSSHERKKDEADYLSARELRQEDAITVGKYISAQKRNNVLSGKIGGVEVHGDHAFWIIYDGPVVIMIPFKDALPSVPESAFVNDNDALNRQRQLLTKSVGAEVPFAVESIEPDLANGIFLVYGSRRIALERIRKRYFGENAPNPIKVGDDVTGTFLAVGSHASWVTVAGVDVRLVPRQLSHRYMENMQEVYKPGDQITLRVQRYEMKDGVPVMALSALPCELEECKSRLNRIRKGNRYIATMTSHRVVNVTNPTTKKKEPFYVASMWLEGVEVPAFANLTNSHSSGASHSGDRVAVEVDQIAKNGYVRVRVISYLTN